MSSDVGEVTERLENEQIPLSSMTETSNDQASGVVLYSRKWFYICDLQVDKLLIHKIYGIASKCFSKSSGNLFVSVYTS